MNTIQNLTESLRAATRTQWLHAVVSYGLQARSRADRSVADLPRLWRHNQLVGVIASHNLFGL
ncbi:MAG: hypothetical protein AABO57_19260 [Acidobacteriota bacterium]